MTFKLFWTWYVENAKSIFLGGMDCVGSGRIGGLELAYLGVFTLLSPLVVPIAALFKTCFDWITRKPRIDLSTRRDEISHLPTEQFDALVDEIITHDYYSSASRRLKNRLQNLPNENDAKLKESLNKDKIEFAQEQLGQQIGSNAAYVKVVDLEAFQLEEKLEEGFLQNTLIKTALFKSQTRTSQMEFIRSYINEENNGKKLMQVIFGIFAKKSKPAFAREEDDSILIVRI